MTDQNTKTIVARYHGICKVCGFLVSPGSEINLVDNGPGYPGRRYDVAHAYHGRKPRGLTSTIIDRCQRAWHVLVNG